MRLRITHRTEYSYDAPVSYALQRIRLVPSSGPTQTVRSWALRIEGAREEVHFSDQFANDTRLVSVEGAPQMIAIEASGEVETLDKAGVYGKHYGFAPLWLFLRETPLTAPGEGIRALIRTLGEGTEIERLHTREIAAYGGLVNNMPKYATAFLIFTMANVGLPGTSGFVGEFLTMIGAFKVNTWVAFFAATGVILSAAYALWLYRRVIFGALTKDSLKSMLDLSPREKVILYPLVILVIFFGVYPAPVFDATAASVKSLVTNVTASIGSAQTAAAH